MSFYTGVGTNLQFGKEAVFGSASQATATINLTSESIVESYDKGDEGSLLASKTATDKDLLGVNVGGSISFVLRPEFAGLLFHGAMGGTDTVTDATEGFYNHTINLCDVNEDLPSLTFKMDRKATKAVYAGCTISSLQLQCSAGDYVKGSFDIVGTYESPSGTMEELGAYTIPSYRCIGATCSYDGMTFDVSSATIKIDNGLVDAPKTFSTGLYKGKPQHGKRTVTLDFEIPYSRDLDNQVVIWKTKGNIPFSITLKANDGRNDYTLSINIPHVTLDSYTHSIAGTGLVTASGSGEALSKGGDEPITVIIKDKHSESYSG